MVWKIGMSRGFRGWEWVEGSVDGNRQRVPRVGMGRGFG